MTLARAGRHRAIVVQCQTLLSGQLNWQGRFDQAAAMGAEAEEIARDIHDGFNELFALSNRTFPLIGSGRYREAWEVINAGLPLARDRQNHFIHGRLTNTLGWLRQEFGDYVGARELDRESADVGARIKNGNVEISALINVGFDDLALGEPQRARELFTHTVARARNAFGSHRWRWSIHLAFGLATVLLALDRDGDALAEIDRGLAEANATQSRKYIGWFLARRGEVALRAGDVATAADHFQRALEVARAIGYPTLTWQAADLLARAHIKAGDGEGAHAAAGLAQETIARIAESAPDPALCAALWQWPRVHAMQETVERARRM
jgi:tetratricopeptide (TPR) repeat protein